MRVDSTDRPGGDFGTPLAEGRASRIPRCTAASGSSHRRARTDCSPVVCFTSNPVPTGRELRRGSFTNSTPASATARVTTPARASLDSPLPFALEESAFCNQQLHEHGLSRGRRDYSTTDCKGGCKELRKILGAPSNTMRGYDEQLTDKCLPQLGGGAA